VLGGSLSSSSPSSANGRYDTLSPTARVPHVVARRLDQGASRFQVIDSYDRRCVVTRERKLGTLEATRIWSYNDGDEHVVSNTL